MALQCALVVLSDAGLDVTLLQAFMRALRPGDGGSTEAANVPALTPAARIDLEPGLAAFNAARAHVLHELLPDSEAAPDDMTATEHREDASLLEEVLKGRAVVQLEPPPKGERGPRPTLADLSSTLQ